MDVERRALAAIAAMALVTYGTRLAGLVLMPRLPSRPWLERWIGYVPGCVLAAIVAPAVLGKGVPELIAAAVTLSLARRTSQLLIPVAAGVVAVWLLRSAL